MPGYLELCIQSWQNACPESEIIKVDQSNLLELSGGRVNARNLAQFAYPLQSDVAAVAVLLEHPGLFMDVDTILLPNFNLETYDTKKLTIYGQDIKYGNHSTAFFVSKVAGNPLLLAWLEEANKRISTNSRFFRKLKWQLRKISRGKPAKVRWNYLGNDILDDLLRKPDLSSCVDIRNAHDTGAYPTSEILLNNSKFENYADLWFSPDFPVAEILKVCQDGIILLQNSWHPPSFNKKTRAEVFDDKAMLSRLLSTVLSINSNDFL